MLAANQIAAHSDIDLAKTPLGLAVRAGAPKPDISTVEAFKDTLLQAKSITYPSSTTGIYMATKLFPQLGIADAVIPKSSNAGIAAVAKGDAEIAIQPVSELLHVPGTDFVGTLPQRDPIYLGVFRGACCGIRQKRGSRKADGLSGFSKGKGRNPECRNAAFALTGRFASVRTRRRRRRGRIDRTHPHNLSRGQDMVLHGTGQSVIGDGGIGRDGRVQGEHLEMIGMFGPRRACADPYKAAPRPGYWVRSWSPADCRSGSCRRPAWSHSPECHTASNAGSGRRARSRRCPA